MNETPTPTGYSSEVPLKDRQSRFLKETVEFYSQDPKRLRAVEYREHAIGRLPTCVYTATGTSPGCAIGRHLAPSMAATLPVESVASSYVWPLMPKWMKELTALFLGGVQALHDRESNWDSNGLTFSGLRNVAEIESAHSLCPQVYNTGKGESA